MNLNLEKVESNFMCFEPLQQPLKALSVTVSHHDPELTFNHSFIEPPSSGWVTEGSSFESDEEEGEALYCVPPREGATSCPLLQT